MAYYVLANGRRIHRKNKSAKTTRSTSNYSFSYAPPRGKQKTIKSLETNICDTSATQKKEYTGTLIKGISTMHKSNAVPILSNEEAKDHAKMRR